MRQDARSNVRALLQSHLLQGAVDPVAFVGAKAAKPRRDRLPEANRDFEVLQAGEASVNGRRLEFAADAHLDKPVLRLASNVDRFVIAHAACGRSRLAG